MCDLNHIKPQYWKQMAQKNTYEWGKAGHALVECNRRMEQVVINKHVIQHTWHYIIEFESALTCYKVEQL